MKSVLSAPRVAWPTLALWLASLAVWGTGVALVHDGRAAAIVAGIALATLGAYLVFTPLHEAAHRSLTRAAWVNGLVGRVSALVLTGPFPAIRWLHLEHHRHTNEHDDDPDAWSGRGPAWLLPVRWMTQDLGYYAFYVGHRRPRAERLESFATLAVLASAAIALGMSGHATTILLGWLVPARLAICVLAFAFDYLPHRPHETPAKVDRHAATHAVEGRVVFALTLGQSLHRVHHLYPGVPFYRYGLVWKAGLAGAPSP